MVSPKRPNMLLNLKKKISVLSIFKLNNLYKLQVRGMLFVRQILPRNKAF